MIIANICKCYLILLVVPVENKKIMKLQLKYAIL